MKSAIAFFEEAMVLYRKMPMNWGILRASIGLTLAGKKTTPTDEIAFEGLDRVLLAKSKSPATLDPNMLIANFP